MKRILSELESIRKTGAHQATLAGGGLLSGSFEHVTPARSYHWDGLKRGGEANHPTWLLQYTLQGHGLFQAGRQSHRIEAGQAFCATIPSAHVYEQDPACPRWSFIWLMINDPYVTGRLLNHPNLNNSLLTLAEDSQIIRSSLSLLWHLVRANSMDLYQLEEYLFSWMLECERWADQQRHPIAPKAKLLDFVRRHTLSHLDSEISTTDLAAACGLTRSNFSHYFRKTTGHTPAAYVLGIRLEEAAKSLRNSGFSIKEIASKTGFTDSNHLCKCFRRHFRMSPGNYREMYRIT